MIFARFRGYEGKSRKHFAVERHPCDASHKKCKRCQVIGTLSWLFLFLQMKFPINFMCRVANEKPPSRYQFSHPLPSYSPP
jgi:hypothetical protein